IVGCPMRTGWMWVPLVSRRCFATPPKPARALHDCPLRSHTEWRADITSIRWCSERGLASGDQRPHHPRGGALGGAWLRADTPRRAPAELLHQGENGGEPPMTVGDFKGEICETAPF